MTDSDTIETYVRDHPEVRETIAAADPENGPWPIHGVAVADGDILHNNRGERILMTAENLADAQYSQAASKLTKDHPDYEGSPPVDDTVGNNSMHYSSEGQAIVYDATTHDEDIAAGVNGETYGVSIHANFDKGPRDPETGAYIAENIVLHDLSVVSLGDSPSNTAQFGGRSDLAAWANEGGLEAAVAEGALNDADDDDDVEGLVRRLATRIGLIDSNDTRGRIWFDDQTSDGETVTVKSSGFDDAPWAVSLHRSGEEFPDVGDGLGPTLGSSDPQDAGDYQSDLAVSLSDSLSGDERLFAMLRYVAEGEVSEPITSSDGAHFVESAFVGVAPDGVEVEAEQGDSRAGESGRDADADGDSMTNRDDDIEFITANSHFSEEMLAEMDDEEVEQTRDLVDDEDGDTTGSADDTGTGQDGDDTPTQIGDMSPEELGTALREQGFVTEDDVGDIAEAANEHASDAEKADEIIAASDEYSEDDKEELVASPFLDRIHTKATTPGAAPIPGVGGGRDTAEAAVGGSDDEYDADDFSTGVAE
ncbi:hypothetical protein ACFPYI_01935 [Halomarina salina]|uniref:DUF7282 domain-containing protein n=1 Tax=Halomarina salina TaxID=1872699 RepID=A0ABD5RIA8_9EURY|nr:hypothetical protein [Halomarina salina]